ncbi:Copper homeostasis CutC domain containing protein [Naviculisporaceae sp. PSN 640]
MLEIPTFGAEHAQLAVSLGAGRLELNAAGSYAAGGTTPSLDELNALRTSLGYDTVPIRVMIRPRGARPNEQDFIYTESELLSMVHSIAQFKESGLLRGHEDGFVFGVVKTLQANSNDGPGIEDRPEGQLEVDSEKNKLLIETARPLKCVFHRAFDDILGAGSQPEEAKKEREEKAFKAVKECGFDGILTSGGQGNASDNKERLGRILALANEDSEHQVEIIVGGGVRSGNLGMLKEALGVDALDSGGEDEGKPACWFHSSCLTLRSGGLEFDGEEVKALVEGLKT